MVEMDLIMWGGILVFLFLCNQLPKLQYFKITQIYHFTGQKPHRFLQVRSPVTVQVDCLLRRVSQFWSQCISWAAFYLMLGVLFQAHANYWQNSVTCGCRTEVPFSCMTLLSAQVIFSSQSPPSGTGCIALSSVLTYFLKARRSLSLQSAVMEFQMA